jgi:hypothetical protein
MRSGRYGGGFDHPLRSFLVGMGLLVLLVAGFVIGVDVGGVDQTTDGTVTRRVRDVCTVLLAADTRAGAARGRPRYVVIDHVRWRVIHVREAPPARPGGRTRLRVVAVPPSSDPSGATVVVTVTPPAATTQGDGTPPVTLLRTVTVDAPAVVTSASTVTATITETVTETVTEPTTDTTATTTEPAPPPPSSSTSSTP